MLATFAFDVCHDVYLAAREVIDTKIPTLSLESAGKYQWHPDRMPRLAEFVADFALAGERALGGGECQGNRCGACDSRREGHSARLREGGVRVDAKGDRLKPVLLGWLAGWRCFAFTIWGERSITRRAGIWELAN